MEKVKNKSMNQSLSRLSIIVIVSFFILVLLINIMLQINMEHHSRRQSTVEVFGQLEQLIEANEHNLEIVEDQFENRCRRALGVVAYAVELNPDMIHDSAEINKMMDVYNINVINFFDDNGVVISSSNQDNVGLSINDTEKFSYFKDLLDDKSLVVYKGEGVNYASNHCAAMWLNDMNCILHIGLSSEFLTVQKQNTSIEKVIAELPFKMSGNIHVIDRKSLKVVASTADGITGKEIQFKCVDEYAKEAIVLHHEEVGGTWHCVYSQLYGDYILVRSYHSSDIVLNILRSSMLILFYYGLGSIGIIFAIRWYLKHYFTDNLNKIIGAVKKIEDGDMEAIAVDTQISEFNELLSYINHMLNSIRLNYNKLSYIMDKGGVALGILEKNLFYKKTFINKRMLEILEIDSHLCDDNQQVDLVELKLTKILENVEDENESVYRFVKDDGSGIKYLKVDRMSDEQSIVYYITDLTMWWDEFNVIKEQSVIDDLTKLYNRRGFNEKMEAYFANIKDDEYGAVILIDSDDLKNINDCIGHHVGDEYLVNISKVLKKIAGDNAICGRLGGDEFVLFLYGYKELDDLGKTIECLKLARGTAFDSSYSDSNYNLQYSVGVAMYPNDGHDFHVLMRIADERMYDEKRSRKIAKADL